MDLHERLVAARRHAGFENAAQAAEALGVPYPTYAGHENGSSGFRSDRGWLYAKRFKVRFEWLMRGAGPMTEPDAKQKEILELLDQLPDDVRDTYLDLLKKIAAPHQAESPDQAQSRAAKQPTSALRYGR